MSVLPVKQNKRKKNEIRLHHIITSMNSRLPITDIEQEIENRTETHGGSIKDRAVPTKKAKR
jgi:hypothetical protein